MDAAVSLGGIRDELSGLKGRVPVADLRATKSRSDGKEGRRFSMEEVK